MQSGSNSILATRQYNTIQIDYRTERNNNPDNTDINDKSTNQITKYNHIYHMLQL